MEFFRGKLGIVTALLCLAALAGIVWFCLFGADRSDSPNGTLVYKPMSCQFTASRTADRELAGNDRIVFARKHASEDMAAISVRTVSDGSEAAGGFRKEMAVKPL